MSSFARTKLALVTLVIASLMPIPSVRADSVDLKIRAIDISSTQVEGGRGAALAILKDGTLLLAGGERGDTLYQYRNDELLTIGTLLQQSERNRDSRFGPTDIGILSETLKRIQLLISYPQLDQQRNCVRLVVFRYSLNRSDSILTKNERWFQGKPCVPLGAVQHAAGRIEVIDSKSAYLTTGDLGFRNIDEKKSRQWLGGVFVITAKKVRQVSSGHRNPQGILLTGSDLYISEHGPRGGDELNLIKQGKDYGWPFVTYGAPYGPGDYIKPNRTGTHVGYEEPIYQWTPSVAPTELVRIPNIASWQGFQGFIVMGTLAAQSLIFIQLTAQAKVGKVIQENVGERIRDLDVAPDGQLVGTTDSGALLFFSLNSN
jgi:hypothetical protein